jgi:hypothetical protein
MHHKRYKRKKVRAGCLMCKSHKMNGASKTTLSVDKVGFSTLRDKYHTNLDLKEKE